MNSISEQVQRTYVTLEDLQQAYPNTVDRHVIMRRMHDVGIYPKWHRAIPVKRGDLEGMIDEKIAGLISKFWSLGIRTTNSCEGNMAGNVWLVFETEEMTHRAIELMGIGHLPYKMTKRERQDGSVSVLLEFGIEYRDMALKNAGEPEMCIIPM